MPTRNTPWLASAAVVLTIICLGGGFWLGRQQGTSVNKATPSAGDARRQALTQQLSSLQALQRQGSTDAAQQQRLLELLVALERKAEAISLLEQWADQQPQRWGLRLLLAELRRDQGDRSGATREVRQLLHVRPNQIEALQLLSLLLIEQGQGPQALRLVQAAHERQSKDPVRPEAIDSGLLLADLLRQQGNPGQAEATLVKLTATFPAAQQPWLARALLQQQRGDTKAAQASLAQARALRPGQADRRLDQVAIAWGLEAIKVPSRPAPVKPQQAPSGSSSP